MASLYIKDQETAALVTRVAKRSGLTKTALVRALVAAREAELDGQKPHPPADEVLERLWQDFPWLLEKRGLAADKAFYDSLNDEEND